MILMCGLTEQTLSAILKTYDLNPILLWEIILKQQYDKVFRIDDTTVFYNIEIIEENQLQRKFIIKVIHLINRNILLVITNSKGMPAMMNLMKKIFKFKSLNNIMLTT